jgi:hypothetical protein
MTGSLPLLILPCKNIMTFHYFTLYPTLNGMSKQTTLARKVDYELLEEILENIKVAVEDQKHNFQKTMSKQQKHKDLIPLRDTLNPSISNTLLFCIK